MNAMTTTAAPPLRIDIGSSHLRVAEGWTTVDLHAPEADVKADMGSLPFEDGAVAEIWASHCLEHVGKERVQPVLAEWLRVLVDGGPAIVSVPNLDYIARYWLHGPDRQEALDLMFGHQTEPGEIHMTGWNPEGFRAELLAAGFEIVSLEVIWEQDGDVGSYHHRQETIRAEVRKPAAVELAPHVH
jgi:SAM-dependent methyltransferase